MKRKILLVAAMSIMTVLPTILPAGASGVKKNYSVGIESFSSVYKNASPNKDFVPYGPLEEFSSKKKSSELENILFSDLIEYSLEPKLITNDKIKEKIDSLYKIINVPKYITKDFFYNSVRVESTYGKNHCDMNAESKVGARGLTQMLPDAWNDVDKTSNYYEDAFNPDKSLENGLKYWIWISKSLKKMNPSWENLSNDDRLDQMIASYNWGIGRLERNNWEFPDNIKETSKYRSIKN